MSMTYDEAVAECKSRAGVREISDDAALALCAAWQSPGGVGCRLAAVASGAWSPDSLQSNDGRNVRFREDLWRTFHNCYPASDDMIVWSALITWSLNGGDAD